MKKKTTLPQKNEEAMKSRFHPESELLREVVQKDRQSGKQKGILQEAGGKTEKGTKRPKQAAKRFRKLTTNCENSPCDFLGLKKDKDTHYSYPSKNHRCHATRSKLEISFSYQEKFCFEDYCECKVYLKKIATQISGHSVPGDIVGEDTHEPKGIVRKVFEKYLKR